MSKFEKGQTVLVRDCDNDLWVKRIFVDCVHGLDFFYKCESYGGSCSNGWKQCIPFMGNEDLEGTTNMPSNDKKEEKEIIFDLGNVKSSIDICFAIVGTFGVYANTLVDLKKHVEEGSHRAVLQGIRYPAVRYCCNDEFWPFFYPIEAQKKPSLTKHLQALANKHKVNFFKEEGDSHYEIYFCVTIDGDSVFANSMFDINYDDYFDDIKNPNYDNYIMPD